ncbi:hypothetical protein VTK26DRAFT_8128 [Humicola hyalothermophila]
MKAQVSGSFRYRTAGSSNEKRCHEGLPLPPTFKNARLDWPEPQRVTTDTVPDIEIETPSKPQSAAASSSPMLSSGHPAEEFEAEFKAFSANVRNATMGGDSRLTRVKDCQRGPSWMAGAVPDESELMLAIWDGLYIATLSNRDLKDCLSYIETLPRPIGMARGQKCRRRHCPKSCSVLQHGMSQVSERDKPVLGGMSLADKMSMWAKKSREGDFDHWRHKSNSEGCLSSGIKWTILTRIFGAIPNPFLGPPAIKAAFYLPKIRREPRYSRSLENCVVLSCSTSSQVLSATTIGDFIDQMWPLEGAEVLRFFQDILQHGVRTSWLVLPSGTEVETTETATTILIWATGAPHFVSELGDQLSWLLAASGPETDFATLSARQPIVRPRNIDEAIADWTCHEHWDLIVNSRDLDASPTIPMLRRLKSQGTLLKSIPLIDGVCPTIDVTDGRPAIEMPPRIFFEFMNTNYLEATQKSVAICGTNVRLNLIKATLDAFIWHLEFPGARCSCRQSFGPGRHPGIKNSELWGSHHFICPCDAADPSGSETPAINQSAVQPCEPDGHFDIQASLLSPDIVRELSNSPPYLTEETSPSGSSIETDILSIPDSPEVVHSPPPSLRDVYQPLVNAVATRLLDEYRRLAISLPMTTCPTASSASSTDLGGLGDSRHSVLCASSPIQAWKTPQKRTNGDRGEEGESDEEERNRRPRKRQRPNSLANRKPTRFLACPFWKLDPSEYRSCFKLALDGIARVKQHLSRKHAPEFYCEFCLEVLPDKDAHRRHVESRKCSYRSCKFSGITHQQQRELSRRSKPNMSESDRWFAVWDIVFPDKTRPASAYMDSDLSEDLCRFREFAQARGPAIVAAEMQALHLAPDAGPVLEGAISRGFERLFDTWLAERGSPPGHQAASPITTDSSPPQNQSGSSTSCPITGETPATSTASLHEQQHAENQLLLETLQENQLSQAVHEYSETAFCFDDALLGIDLATPGPDAGPAMSDLETGLGPDILPLKNSI